ncbi:hypothetical protein RSSM_02917 [Rhodopirellula sallentina SM41]|uniref:Uncharacterized protein n=1 Tax=Rhodopirellula sallentina SM41 TaxID=1263870 RepID=M5U2E6_9BACT|nr:hypothetical protein RSSM_02917 [Rhodopirellula sallentina SM41]
MDRRPLNERSQLAQLRKLGQNAAPMTRPADRREGQTINYSRELGGS